MSLNLVYRYSAIVWVFENFSKPVARCYTCWRDISQKCRTDLHLPSLSTETSFPWDDIGGRRAGILQAEQQQVLSFVFSVFFSLSLLNNSCLLRHVMSTLWYGGNVSFGVFIFFSFLGPECYFRHAQSNNICTLLNLKFSITLKLSSLLFRRFKQVTSFSRTSFLKLF